MSIATGRFDVMLDPARTVLGSLAHWARSAPDAPAVCLLSPAGETLTSRTYHDLAHATSTAARTLAHHAATDETVLLHAPNGFEYVSWFLAGLLAGVRVAALHPSTTRHEVARVAMTTHARIIIGPHPHPPLLHLPTPLPPETSNPIEAANQRAHGSVILQSSGTGGTPKLARRTQAALDADARALAHAVQLTSHDRVLAIVPLSHSYGVDILVATILAGASLQIFERFELAGVQNHLRRAGATVFPGVPFIFDALARSASSFPAEHLRLAFSAGSPLPPRIYTAIHSACGLRVGQLYGATELGTVTLNHPDTPNFDPQSVGSPVHGASVRIVSPSDPDHVLPTGVEGELAVSAPSMLAEYLDAPLPLADGHLLTGDLGRIDSLGRVYLTGRLKHLIDVGGMKINPLEVEQVIAEHPGIAECALVPLPLSDTVVKLRLLFVPRDGASPSPDDIRAFARERLSPHKLPRVFEPVAALPRSATGKLLRHLLSDA